MLTWNKENLWNYHVSLVRERDSRLWSAVISQYHFAHILVTRHWVAYHISSFNIENCGSSTMHISTAAHCTCPLSYIAGDTDQCFLLSTLVFGSIESFPKHRSRERCSVPLEIFQNTDDRRLLSDFTLIVKLCSSSHCKHTWYLSGTPGTPWV